MGKSSKIEWTHHTFNAWEGCEKVSPACKNCYAETRAVRFGHSKGGKHLPLWGPGSRRKWRSDAYWRQPLKWNREAAELGERHRVFCMSLGDVFEILPVDHPDLHEHAVARMRLLELIEKTPHLDWLLLTKRPENIAPILNPWTATNVWLGTTVENPETAEQRIPHLLAYPAAVYFVSCEPLLAATDLSRWLRMGTVCECDHSAPRHERCTPDDPEAWIRCNAGTRHIDWVIDGGESGRGARPPHPDWFRAHRNQCAEAGVPYLFKQWGEWAPRSHHPNVPIIGSTRWGTLSHHGSWFESTTPWNGHDDDGIGLREAVMVRMGKKAAGRLLDGVEHTDFPEPRSIAS